jgi:hypothetical protein
LAARQDSLGDGPLNNMLEKLEAAEWHILHRQGSINRASLHESLLSARKTSNSARRSSAASNASSTLVKSNTIAELTEFVNDAERRKRDGSANGSRNRPKEQAQDHTNTNDTKPKRKKVKKATLKKSKIHLRKDKSAPELTTASSISLSAMLREELRIATRERAAKAKVRGLSSTTKLRSHSLVDKVAHVEDKRKKVIS